MEEIEIGETPNLNIKKIEINKGDNKYICQLQVIKNFIHVFIFDNNILKYKGYIHISNIQYYLGIYDFNIDDIFDEINKLNNNKFKIIKDINKYQLKIEFIILNQKRYLDIDLKE